MNPPFSKRVQKLIGLIPDQTVKAKTLALLEDECASVSPPTAEVLDRVRFAVVKLALQGQEYLGVAEELYRIDTRDLLVIAGFAEDIHAHEAWYRSVMGPTDG